MYRYWHSVLSASGMLVAGLFKLHLKNEKYYDRLPCPTLLCWTGVTLGTLWCVCFLQAGCPAVLELLSATQKSIQSPRYRMMCVAHNHWHSFLQSVHSAAPHYMLARLYVYHGRGRPLHWCQSYNGRCEIWTDTVRLQSSPLLFPSSTSPSETHWHCFYRLLRVNFCTHTGI